ncbi:hypothetical protein [Aeromicrobium fastidiosum]|uniref:Uncharacterized protein n=1 Tax=Aeromicrobium fastidiosum TaxID=52699 RepID=A0A641AP23_9ACTN|nr:hypothetical protein [Aeromicrobium fastidiosum]KAA1379689.1 hypothetical protein ESP62_000240 [Aeromicrobium fastidiosum]MBP2389170.1 hypothetical protein [Aeromicrobium fastidiosum]
MTSSGPDRAERERRRRAADLLGDLLPSTTSDETDEGWGERGGASRGTDARDDEFLRDVPPHHG